MGRARPHPRADVGQLMGGPSTTTGTTTAGALGVNELVAWLRRFADAVEVHAEELSSLDAAIGDADHGTNLRRGCRAVVAALDAEAPADAAAFGKAVAMALIASVGGASGPLYGTFFLSFGQAAGPTATLDTDTLATAWRAGLDGVVRRGKAEVGDKTMVDALAPAVEALEQAAGDGATPAVALRAALAAAEAGRDATTPLVARRGRASYLGERSAGHTDPGAASTVLLVRAAAGQAP